MQATVMQATTAAVTPAMPVREAAASTAQPVAPAAPSATPASPATNASDASQPAAATPANAPAIATAPVAANATTQNAQSTAGVTFPVRPAATASTQSAAPAVGHASAADAGSIGGALFSLVLVVGLILALGWLARRMPGMQRGAAASNLKVVASVSLGPRERAVVVDVGGTQLLVGVGQGGVRTLHTLAAPLPVAEASNTPSPFAQVLAQHFGRKP